MKKLSIVAITTALSLLITHYSFFPVSAQTISQQVTLTYPIPQLENCRDAKECYFYCEIPRNETVCQNFAVDLTIPQVLGVSTAAFRQRVIQAATNRGISFPLAELGGCDGPEACRAYCSEEDNHLACRTFSQKHNLRRRRATARISYPLAELGGCDSREACKTYCRDEANRETCRTFATNRGIRVRKKVYDLLQNAKAEFGCETLAACKAYCTNPENSVSCRAFGLRHRQLNRDSSIERRDTIRDLRPSDASPSSIRPSTRDSFQDSLENRTPDSFTPAELSPDATDVAPL